MNGALATNDLRRNSRGGPESKGYPRQMDVCRAIALIGLMAALLIQAQAQQASPAPVGTPPAAPAAMASHLPDRPNGLEGALHTAILRHLGKPYVWGATGLKSFDCSGFVWRVLFDSGILIKRTTARKLYMCLPKVEQGESLRFGRLVFFENRTHVGFLNDPESFYHAQCSKGTNLSSFKPYWSRKVCGYRALPTRGDTE
jgi:cell wall-associated NlpC family hydrolase